MAPKLLLSLGLLALLDVTAKRIHRSGRFPVKLLDSTVVLNKIKDSLPHPQDHEVNDLPGLPSNFSSKQFAGHLPVSSDFKGGHLFYWLVEAETKPLEKPLVIWLNGGPGCSSLEGLFQEIGPFSVGEGGNSLDLNPYSWHKRANLLFVDQPVGTGLSFVGNGGYALNQTRVNSDFYRFLQNFFKVHVDYLTATSTRSVYFFGESYAGRYIPSIVDYILSQNRRNDLTWVGDASIDVNGVGIGNGWTHPRIQYNYGPFALSSGLIGKEQAKLLKDQYDACLRALDAGATVSDDCNTILDVVISQSTVPGGAQVNYYDFRLYNKDVDSWPSLIENLPLYLDRVDVRSKLHASRSPHGWAECSDPVYDALADEDAVSTTPQVESILTSGVRALFYNGQFDLICNHWGTLSYLHELKWPGLQAFVDDRRGVWSVDGVPAGYAKGTPDGYLTFLVFLGGSHMAPMDRPRQALDMLSRFLDGKSYKDYEQVFDLPFLTESTHRAYLPVLVIAAAVCAAMMMAWGMYKYWNRATYTEIGCESPTQAQRYSI